ncbi:MAG: hypothetical protein WBI47_10440, partial [Atribacterales bacterium]
GNRSIQGQAKNGSKVAGVTKKGRWNHSEVTPLSSCLKFSEASTSSVIPEISSRESKFLLFF